MLLETTCKDSLDTECTQDNPFLRQSVELSIVHMELALAWQSPAKLQG